MRDPQVDHSTSRVKVYTEVTDTISISYTTGIQRVVREIVSRLDTPDYPDIEVIPVFSPAAQRGFRLLTDTETRALHIHPAGGQAGRRADKFGPLAPVVKVLGDTKIVYQTRIRYRQARSFLRERRFHTGNLAVERFESGSVFFDIEGSWFDPEPRSTLLPKLRQDGVHLLVFIHDVMPALYPEWFDPRQVSAFTDWLTAHVTNSTRFLTNSRCTSNDLLKIASRMGVDLTGRIHQAALGADFVDRPPVAVRLPNSIDKYLLVVGTVEPRKNHQLVLNAWDELRRTNPGLGLVLVGKEGWMVDDLVNRIRSHEEFGNRLQWLGGLTDAELLWLYQNAFITVAPSRYEGLGVPVIEALVNGSPAIVSTGGALPEAGEGHTELVDPDSVGDLVHLILRHIEEPDHHERMVSSALSFEPPNWDETTAAVAQAIRSTVESPQSKN
ncbi:MAG: glycosyltransferase family 4 protein [Microthrixaceae bacterium]|nr:glycosyltransferase family 4 protein [Microthrixaceae bacterium]